VIKAEETATLYNLMRKSQVHNIDYEAQPKDWHHPPDSVRITEEKDEHAIKYLDGSKSEHGVGASIAIFIRAN